MSMNETETLASLRVLVCMAKADGILAPEERSVLEDALKGAKLPGNVTTQSLLDGTYDLDAELANIKSQEARDATFSSVFAMAYADRHLDPAEQAILDKVEKAFVVPKEKKNLLGRVFAEAKDTVSMSRISPIADPVQRQKEINEDIWKYSILAGALGAFPVPGLAIATDLAALAVQAKMFRDIGQYWGRETSKDAIKQVIAGVGVGAPAQIAVFNLVKLVPGVGSAVGAIGWFASTYAVGKVANQYWESGGKADMKMLKELFKRSKEEGKKEYEKNKAAIDAKAKENKAALETLASDYKAGKITQAEYEKRVLELK